MDLRLQQAAETGSIDELYTFIKEDPYILEKIDAVPFIDTPLHVAAACGNVAFAVEMLNLKPSFATKLNTSGYSPLHLAVENDQGNFVTCMLRLDDCYFRVKGRNGITPFLLLVERGNAKLVTNCLDRFPECIQDVNVDSHNALQLAVAKNRCEVLQILTGWIQKNDHLGFHSIEYYGLNREDFKLNTPLHLAAIEKNKQAATMLLKCRRVKRNIVNDDGFTFLDIFKNGGGDSGLGQVVAKTGCERAATLPRSKKSYDILKSPLNFWTFRSTYMRRQRSYTSGEDRGAFLIICILIITATYQTALQPPGGVHESGCVVMTEIFYILVWFFNTLGFCFALLFTYYLIPPALLISVWFFWIGIYLGVSYALAMAVISPHPQMFLFATFAFFLLFILFVFLGFPLLLWRIRYSRFLPRFVNHLLAHIT